MMLMMVYSAPPYNQRLTTLNTHQYATPVQRRGDITGMHRRALVKPQRRNMGTFSLRPRKVLAIIYRMTAV